MSSSILPPHPSLEQLKKQAKSLFKAFQAADRKVAVRLKQSLSHLSGLSDQEVFHAKISLKDTQHIIAREHGFGDWAALKRHVDIEDGLEAIQAGWDTDLKLGKKYKGKVRDVYEHKGKVFLISTDRQSAFDRSLAHIPFKGQVLTQTSAFWFEQTKDIVQNHIIDVPDPNVVVGKKLTVFPVEMVIRGYLTGVTETAAWTAYAKGERLFCGNVLPEGMQKNQKFPEPIITPTTKDEVHDEKISAEEIVEQALMTQEQWDYVADKTKKIFQRGQEIAAKNGLILVDTKYEFGYDDEGNIYLLDEIHTPDSSRFWLKDSYEQRFSEGKEPENIDKEFLRLWFKENSDPYNDEVLPDAPEELVVELSKRYIQLFEMITGQEFKAEPGDVKQRIENNLKEKGYM